MVEHEKILHVYGGVLLVGGYGIERSLSGVLKRDRSQVDERFRLSFDPAVNFSVRYDVSSISFTGTIINISAGPLSTL